MEAATEDARDPDAPVKIHAFEERGLGRAPYECIADYWLERAEQVCDYCGTCIAHVYVIRGADRRTFIVGCVCVFKTGDRGLIDTVKRAEAARRRQKQNAQADARIEAAKVLLQSEIVRERLTARPHQNEHLAAQKRTQLDYVNWLFEHAGRSGKLRAAKIIEAVAPPASND